ncbi:hypothetical protein BDZ89DRAFT_1065346 [Hymenopellis radicata]|nr:hypothetical protein BDZ89DRAFT_1065346 [Hymenopellis radicata]
MAAGLVSSALIRIDDTDPHIKFSAGWCSGGVNAEYNATTHGTTTDPQYQQLFYSSPVVDDGDHVLVIMSTVEESHFWLDYFSYSPSASASSTSTVVPDVETGGITSLNDTSTSSQFSSSQIGSSRNDALLGALIGALSALVLLLCAVAFVYLRTRRRQNLKATAFVAKNTSNTPALSLDERLAASEAGPLPPMHNVFGHDDGDRVRASVVPSTPSSHQYLGRNSRPPLYCQNDVEGNRREKNYTLQCKRTMLQ